VIFALALPVLTVTHRVLWVVCLISYGLLLWKLWGERLAGIYPFFSSYLAYRFVRGVVLYSLPYNTNAYGWVWMVTEPLAWVLYILVVLELYSLVLRNYKGIATLGRWTLMGALGLSIVISALTLWADLSNPAERFPILLYFTAIERGIVSSLAIFLLLITAFLVWYPVPLSRNVVVYSVVYSVYFLSTTMGFVVRNIAGNEATSTVHLVLMSVTVCCLVAWIVLLNRRSESATLVVGQRWRPDEGEQLVEQLTAINSALLRAARK
jgi:hypothetical protein